MKTITLKLQGTNELSAKESLPEVPALVQKYLDLKEYQTEGKFFRVVIEGKSRDSGTDGMAYLNELRIEKRNGDQWVRVYSTGMMQYRGAYSYEIDNWDLSLGNPTIFEESENKVTYALSTGVGNVKVYRFTKGQPKEVVTFNTRAYKATQERIELLRKVSSDTKAFRSYVEKGLGHRWRTNKYDCQVFGATGERLISKDAEQGELVVLLAEHADRDYDAISDQYQLYVWVKGKGFVSTDKYQTGLHHPGGKFYRIGVFFNTTITSRGQNSLNLTVEARSESQPWKESRDFRVEW